MPKLNQINMEKLAKTAEILARPILHTKKAKNTHST